MSKAHLWTGTPRLSTTSRHHLGSQAEDLSQDCALAYRHASSGRGLKDTDEDHRTFLFLCWSLPGSQSPVLVSLFVPDAPEPEDEDARHTSSVGLLLSAVGRGLFEVPSAATATRLCAWLAVSVSVPLAASGL